VCVDFSRELLEIMKDHLAAEQDLYNAAFVLKDTVAAHEANVRAVSLLQRSAELRVRFEHTRSRNTTGMVWRSSERSRNPEQKV
jgi:hypothetical protein